MNLAGHRDRRLSENYFEPCTVLFAPVVVDNFFGVNMKTALINHLTADSSKLKVQLKMTVKHPCNMRIPV